MHDIDVGTTICTGTPAILNETVATAFVDGNNLLGPVCFVRSCAVNVVWHVQLSYVNLFIILCT